MTNYLDFELTSPIGENFDLIKNTQKLVHVPKPEMFESPSSWLSRLALSQGIEICEAMKYLKINQNGDADIQFVKADIMNIGAKCGIPKQHFSFMCHMFSQLVTINSFGTNLLLSYQGSPRYRYCPKCLDEQLNAHFPVHWRFLAWRWCPLHQRLLNDDCSTCRSPIILPNSLINAGLNEEGVASLNRCLSCGTKLSTPAADSFLEEKHRMLSVQDHLLLKNGRALLSTLYHGYFCMGKIPYRFPLPVVNALVVAGNIPNRPMHYENVNSIWEQEYE